MERLSAQRLREVLDYDERSGFFTWRVKTSKKIIVGQIAGCLSHGYIAIKIDGRMYGAHQLAWLHVTGNWPVHSIDHRDGIRSNNVFSNLREANGSQNQQNKKRQKNNTSGFKGAAWSKQAKKWCAHIHFNGTQKTLGNFDSAEEAHAAYCKAALQYHGEFANHG